MSKPDSLLAAVRQVAAGAGMSWAEVQPFYRALQESGGENNSPWLPKSHGRNIWAAHPHFVARVIFALAGARSPSNVHEVVDEICEMTPGGRQKYLTEKPAAGILAPLETLFFRYLTDSALADDVISIELYLEKGEVVVNTKSEGSVVYSRPIKAGDGKDRTPRPYRAIYSRGVIDGILFRFLANSVSWRLSDQPPFESAKPGDELDD